MYLMKHVSRLSDVHHAFRLCSCTDLLYIWFTFMNSLYELANGVCLLQNIV